MISKKDHFTPKARQEGLVVQQLEDEVLVYDNERFKAHCLNRTAALVWQHCNGKKTIQDIALALEKEAGSPVGEEVVWLALGQLGKSRLLTERVMPAAGKAGISRREVIRRVGIATAVALPVVTSIVAPKAAQAANCLPSGSTCTTAVQCCSNLCPGAPSSGVCS
ncbi:MAG: PqqD family protein [Acidobacteriota bacterium]